MQAFMRCCLVRFLSLPGVWSLFVVSGTGLLNASVVDNTDPDCSDLSGNPFCTIQAAIDAAVPGETISIGAGTYFENLVIAKSLTLEGAGMDETLVDGAGLDRVVSIEGDHVVTLSKLTLQNGGGAEKGGGIYNTGTLSLTDCRIADNRAIGRTGGWSYTSIYNITYHGEIRPGFGGGIYNTGILSLNNCCLNDNTTGGGRGMLSDGEKGFGGGIYRFQRALDYVVGHEWFPVVLADMTINRYSSLTPQVSVKLP